MIAVVLTRGALTSLAFIAVLAIIGSIAGLVSSDGTSTWLSVGYALTAAIGLVGLLIIGIAEDRRRRVIGQLLVDAERHIQVLPHSVDVHRKPISSLIDHMPQTSEAAQRHLMDFFAEELRRARFDAVADLETFDSLVDRLVALGATDDARDLVKRMAIVREAARTR